MEEKPLPDEFKEFIQCLNSNDVEYLLLGGWAVVFYGHPRATKDIDFLLSNSPENIEKAKKALIDFKGPPLNWKDFKKDGHVYRIGSSPILIDIINKASGIEFDDCYKRRVIIELDGLQISSISKEDLVKNKTASGRLQDLADVEVINNRNTKSQYEKSDDVLRCLKYKLIDTRRYKTLEAMKLVIASDYGGNIIKYKKTLKNETQYYLCREVSNSEIELFHMNKTFTKKQALQFLADWDTKYGNNVQKVALPKKPKPQRKS